MCLANGYGLAEEEEPIKKKKRQKTRSICLGGRKIGTGTKGRETFKEVVYHDDGMRQYHVHPDAMYQGGHKISSVIFLPPNAYPESNRKETPDIPRWRDVLQNWAVLSTNTCILKD